MSEFVATIEEIGIRMQRIALNANIKAIRIGEQGSRARSGRGRDSAAGGRFHEQTEVVALGIREVADGIREAFGGTDGIGRGSDAGAGAGDCGVPYGRCGEPAAAGGDARNGRSFSQELENLCAGIQADRLLAEVDATDRAGGWTRSWRRRNPWPAAIRTRSPMRSESWRSSTRCMRKGRCTSRTTGESSRWRRHRRRLGRERGVVLDGNRKASYGRGDRMSALAGEVTLAAAGRLQAELRECLAGGSPVVLDLERVTEIDLAGLQVLLAAGRSFAAARAAADASCGESASSRLWAEAGYPCGEVCGGKDNHDRG